MWYPKTSIKHMQCCDNRVCRYVYIWSAGVYIYIYIYTYETRGVWGHAPPRENSSL